MAAVSKQPALAPLLPHGKLQPLFDNIWFIQGQVKMPMLLPAKISRSMTIYKNPVNGHLTLINSMRLSEEGLEELQALGPITNVIRIGGFHGRDDLFYQRKFKAKIFAIQGQTYSRKMEPPTTVDEGYMKPDVWVSQAGHLPFENCKIKIFSSCNPPEAALLITEHDGVLVTADSLQNTPKPDQFVNAPMVLMMSAFGFWAPYNVGPGWVKFAKPRAGDIRSIMELDFEHVLPGHGQAVIGNAKDKYRSKVDGRIKGCYE